MHAVIVRLWGLPENAAPVSIAVTVSTGSDGIVVLVLEALDAITKFLEVCPIGTLQDRTRVGGNFQREVPQALTYICTTAAPL